MEGTTFDHPEAIAAAMGVLDRHLAALNAGDASLWRRRSIFRIIAWLGGA